LNRLGLLYTNQGKYDLAKPLYKRALAIREKALGKDHPLTAISLNNLAFLYASQGKHSLARPLYKRAIAICESSLGVDHPTTIQLRENLADIQNGGKAKNAKPPSTAKSNAANKKNPEEPENMVCPGLGTKCNYFQGDWSGEWVRRGSSNIFDCTMFHGPARETCTYVASLEVKGESVIVRRTEVKSTIYGVAPAGAVDEYIWHLGKDSKSLYETKDPTHPRLVRAE